MFNTSLRRSPIWSSTIPSLATPSGLNLRESSLAPHVDISIPLPQPHTRALATNRPPVSSQKTLHVILLTAEDFPQNPPQNHNPTTQRLERLATMTGGENALIIFALNTPSPGNLAESPRESTEAAPGECFRTYAHLQSTILSNLTLKSLRIIPLHKPSSLAPTLLRYRAALTTSPIAPPVTSTQAERRRQAFTLLTYCTKSAPETLLTEHAALVITDVVGNMRRLAECMGSEEGRARFQGELEGIVEGEDVRGLVEFWREEWVVE